MSSKKRIIEIQNEWKMLPNIPKSEYVPLFVELRALHDEFFNKIAAVQKQKRTEKQAKEHGEGMKVKKHLIADIKSLLENVNKNQIADLKKIQSAWKSSPKVKKEDNEVLWGEFSMLCDEFFERKALEIESIKKGKGKKAEEVLKMKIQYLKDSIKNDKKNIQRVEENLGAFRLNISSKKMENLFINQDKNKERKVIVKEKLLLELNNELEKLKNSTK